MSAGAQVREAGLVQLSLDGRAVQAPVGSTVLEVARRLGLEIPTLCHHPDLEPTGACRLCMVEVTHPDWGGWSGLMTACLYPVAPGIQVSTRSERVLQARRQVLALLSARCPGSEIIRALAERHGADPAGMGLQLGPAEQADDCILCGLCTRVCESHATSAITTFGRGSMKAVGPFFELPPEECVGCGACAALCPTGHLTGRRSPGAYHIWGRSFAAFACQVNTDLCAGCGACEQACPFAVARVVLTRGQGRFAVISADHCRGCGVCVGACPGGAIDQAGDLSFAALARRLVSGPFAPCPEDGFTPHPHGTGEAP